MAVVSEAESSEYICLLCELAWGSHRTGHGQFPRLVNVSVFVKSIGYSQTGCFDYMRVGVRRVNAWCTDG